VGEQQPHGWIERLLSSPRCTSIASGVEGIGRGTWLVARSGTGRAGGST
jgi:hypothetical protein